MVQSIRVGGSFDGTPTGDCVLDAGKNAHFPPLQGGASAVLVPVLPAPLNGAAGRLRNIAARAAAQRNAKRSPTWR